MKNKLNIELKGYIKVYRNGKLIHEQPNSIQSGAYNVLRRTLVGDSGYLDRILVYKNNSALATASITQKTYSSTNKITVAAIFDENSFNDTFDEIYIKGSIAGSFSKVSGLSITKDNLSQISIEWSLEFLITGVTP